MPEGVGQTDSGDSIDEFRISPVRSTGQRSKLLPKLILIFIGVFCVIVVASIWTFSSIIRTPSPSEQNAQQQRDAIAKAKAEGNVFAGIALAMVPKGSLDVQIAEQPIFRKWQKKVEMEITNLSSEAIASLEGNIEFVQKGRTIPFCQGNLFGQFTGGIEPGETVNLQCSVYETNTQEATAERLKNGAFWQVYINTVVTGENAIYASSQHAVKLKIVKNLVGPFLRVNRMSMIECRMRKIRK